jgi:hypothetical protein
VAGLSIKRLLSNATAVHTDRFMHYKTSHSRLDTSPKMRKTGEMKGFYVAGKILYE